MQDGDPRGLTTAKTVQTTSFLWVCAATHTTNPNGGSIYLVTIEWPHIYTVYTAKAQPQLTQPPDEPPDHRHRHPEKATTSLLWMITFELNSKRVILFHYSCPSSSWRAFLSLSFSHLWKIFSRERGDISRKMPHFFNLNFYLSQRVHWRSPTNARIVSFLVYHKRDMALRDMVPVTLWVHNSQSNQHWHLQIRNKRYRKRRKMLSITLTVYCYSSFFIFPHACIIKFWIKLISSLN